MDQGFNPYHKWLGIPAGQQPPNLYQLLGIEPFETDADVIETAADRQMAHVRSLGGGQHVALAQRVLNELSAARVTLLNPAKKSSYDQQLRAAQAVPERAQRASVAAPTPTRTPVAPARPIDARRPVVAARSASGNRRPSQPWWQTPVGMAVLAIGAIVVVGSGVVLSGLLDSQPEEAVARADANPTADGAEEDSLDATEGPNTIAGDAPKPNEPAAGAPSDSSQAAPVTDQDHATIDRAGPPTSSRVDGQTEVTSPFQVLPDGPNVAGDASPDSRASSLPESTVQVAPRLSKGVLNFAGAHRLRLEGSEGFVRPDGRGTIEIWAKINPELRPLTILGDFVLGGKHELVPKGQTAGLFLHLDRVEDQKDRLAVMHQGQGKDVSGPAKRIEPLDDGWHHLAICFEPGLLQLYVDGQRLLNETGFEFPPTSPAPLVLGPPRDGDVNWQMHGQVAAVRLSSTHRYREPFTPPAELVRDQQATAVLNLDGGVIDGQIRDLAGQHHGTLLGATWVETAALDQVADAGTDHPDRDVSDEAAAPPAARTAVPAKDQVDAAVKVIRDVFDTDYAEAKTAQQRVALASKLLDQAKATRDDPPSQFALLVEAREIAEKAGHAPLVMETLEYTGERFEIDTLAQQSQAIVALGRGTMPNEVRQQFVEIALEVARQAAAAERFDEADALVQVANASAVRLRDAELRKAAGVLRERLTQARKDARLASQAREALQRDPNNAAAHAALGRYLALVRGEWTQALPHLAKSDLPALRQAAPAELAEPTAASGQAGVGDAWWDAAEAAASADKAPLLGRARHWYQQATSSGLEGLAKVKVDKRLEELAQIAASTDAGDSKTRARLPAGASPGMIGAARVNGTPIPLAIVYQQGKSLKDSRVRDELSKRGVTGSSIQLEMLGVVGCDRPREVKVRHRGGSSSGGVLRLYLNGRELGAVGDDRSKDSTYPLTLPQGVHSLRWSLRGGSLGDCLVDVIDVNSGEALPIFYNRAVAAQLGTVRELVDITADEPAP